MSDPETITMLLQRAESGDREAANELYGLVEPELKAIVERRKRRQAVLIEDPTTAVVDDAFLRLVGQGVTTWQSGDRRKFFSYMAIKIHDLLVDTARAQLAEKRGGKSKRVNQDGEDPVRQDLDECTNADFLIDLKSSLDEFEQFAPHECMVFRIRYFLGCTFEETAEMLSLSATEAKRQFQKAQLWLQRQLREYGHEE